ncbi:MAG: betaine--homocysteine S-methyltransferase [Caldilineales bacterium]|nr:betaine--homocysteine S-methyltransferase [Caldilineales bacterium]
MSRDIYQLLESKTFVVGDGAMGTMMQQAGLTDGGAPELWNVEHPDAVIAIYQGYVDAGSQVIETNTFGGTSFRLKLHHLQDRVFELNKAGAELARQVAGNEILVAGSVGPTGELFEPMGSLTHDAAVSAFADQASGLVAGGVDMFIIETMSDLQEVLAAVEGIRQVSDLPIAATMTFDTNYRTMMGVTPAKAVKTLADAGVKIIGANCGNGPDEIRRVVGEMAAVRPGGIFLMAQSNAGLPKFHNGEIKYDGTPEVMADYALDMASMGVDLIGACCGSTPAHIHAMKEALNTRPIPAYTPPEPVVSVDAVPQRSERRRERRPR